MSRNVKAEGSSKFARAMMMGAVIAGLACLALAALIRDQMIDPGLSPALAATVGLLYVLIAALVGLGVVSPRLGATVLNVEDADDLREQRRVLGWSTLGMAGMGAILLLLAFAAPVGPVPHVAVGAGGAALGLLGWVASRRQQARSDEMMVALHRASSATAFSLVTTIGGTWAAVAHLGYVATPAPLDWITLLAAAGLVSPFAVSARQGLLKAR